MTPKNRKHLVEAVESRINSAELNFNSILQKIGLNKTDLPVNITNEIFQRYSNSQLKESEIRDVESELFSIFYQFFYIKQEINNYFKNFPSELAEIIEDEEEKFKQKRTHEWTSYLDSTVKWILSFVALIFSYSLLCYFINTEDSFSIRSPIRDTVMYGIQLEELKLKIKEKDEKIKALENNLKNLNHK
jgi:hypothetical protein